MSLIGYINPRKSVLNSTTRAVIPFIAQAASETIPKKEKLKTEKIRVLDDVDWAKAQSSILSMIETLRSELATLETETKIQNAYSPITWVKLCRQVRHVQEGMTSVRLSAEGKSASEINRLTGIDTRRVGAFKAWNTMWRNAIDRVLTISFHNEQERQADISFLRSIGVAVGNDEKMRG